MITFYIYKMSKRFYYKWIMVLPVLLGKQVNALAQFEEGKAETKIAPIVGVAIDNNASSTVTYDYQGELPNPTIANIITLKIDETSGIFPQSGFVTEVNLNVEVKLTLGSAWQVLSNVPNLTITYDPATGAKYDVRSYFKLPNPAQEVRITVNSVSTAFSVGAPGWNPLPLLKLENEMRILRYFNLSTNQTVLTPAFTAPTFLTDALKVKWSWNAATNHNMSQLEWAWVENDMETFYFPGGVVNTDFLFNNNSTRIDLDFAADSFKIPLLYPNAGKLYYRVRAALRKNDGNVFTGPWSPAQNYAFAGHEINLNWQSSTSFAENGKYKTVIQYFDGSLRGRQTVTKDNERGNTVVGETIYDLQGRPNVQILPTPTLDQTIKYFTDFNRFVGQSDATQNPAELFDLAAPGAACTGAPALNTAMGNGKYYSPNNDWLIGNNAENKSKYIPNAQGYAYTETRFMDDATERVRSQGGVGPNHQIGSGHETKYFYGKPYQKEMDALFGTEVGYASHYSKNLVIDANGQASVSYVDMHGRTIATALAGEAPANVIPIKNNTDDYPQATTAFTEQLLTPATNLVRGNSIESISTFLVPANTNYAFSYTLDPAIFSQANCDEPTPTTICWDCKYDLEISMRPEDCSSPAIVKKYSNLQLVPANSACTESMGFVGELITVPTKVINFSQELTVGSWVVRKTLTINQENFEQRKAQALQEFLCVKEADIFLEVKNALKASSGCDVPNRDAAACTACSTALGANYAAYKTKYLNDIGNPVLFDEAAIAAQYEEDKKVCEAACKPGANFSSLKQLRNQLLADVTPYTGQYALDPTDPNNTIGTEESKFNIFTTTASPLPKPFFRYPKTEAGGDGAYQGAVINVTTVTPSDFAGVFQSQWASQLIYYHPEFSKLKFAETYLVSTYKWADDIKFVDGYSMAGNFLNPLTSDPYFVNNYVPADNGKMQQYLTQFLPASAGNPNPNANNTPSIWQLANASVVCATTPDAQKQACILGTTKTGLAPQITSNADKNKVWQRFKGLYLSYRNEMLISYIHGQPNVLNNAGMIALQNDGKQLRFAKAREIANQTSGAGAWWDAAANATTTTLPTLPGLTNTWLNNNNLNVDNCQGQRPFWKSRLLQCEQLTTLINSNSIADVAMANNIISDILDGLVLVCQNSKTTSQPYGASTVNPGYTGTPQSFEAVINNVFTQYGIVTNASNINYFCNPFTIDAPKPFGKGPALFTNYSSQIDDCNCERFSALKEEAAVAGYNALDFNSMNTFLDANYHETLSLPLWTGLQNCAGLFIDTCAAGTAPAPANGLQPSYPGPPNPCLAYRPLYLTDVVAIPAFLNCGYTKPCLNCAQLTALTAEFRQLYPVYNGVPYTATNPAEAQIKENALWARFINFRTGFSLSAFDYLSAYASCSSENSGYIGNGYDCGPSTAVDNLFVNARLTPLSAIYIARQTIEFQNSFESNANDEFTTSLEPGLGTCDNPNGIAGDPIGGTSNYVLCSFDKPLNDISWLGPPATPCQQVETQAAYIAQFLFTKKKEKLIADFEKNYTALCLGAKDIEQFSATYMPKEYHYTLYYYDQAGSLVKTLPPAAVKPNYNATYLANVAAQRNAGTDATANNNELLATHYRYNTLNQVVAQKTPDAGISKFWYDALGRLVVSQNAKQQLVNDYSYTLYDHLGRITEVGQRKQTTAMSQTISQNILSANALSNWLNDNTAASKEQITLTVYDKPYQAFIPTAGSPQTVLLQKNLRNRVSYSMFFDSEAQKMFFLNGTVEGGNSATYYSYDIHGNVDELLQDYKLTTMGTGNNRFKKIAYSYDLISGKVNDVAYQPVNKYTGEEYRDQFYHHYEYDAENRLTEVKTSKDKIYWEKDASYDYYRHGPMARTVLGQNEVQNLRYVYTIQGWLKGVNSQKIINSPDNIIPGATVIQPIDAIGYSLGYYAGDYVPIDGTGNGFLTSYQPPVLVGTPGMPPPYVVGSGLYNGNISYATYAIRGIDNGATAGYTYGYDQLNRLRVMNRHNYPQANNVYQPWNETTIISDYHEEVTYDPNGNIRTYQRNGFGTTTLAMDNLTYQYEKNASGQIVSNKLRYVHDDQQVATNYTEDIETQTTLTQADVQAEKSVSIASDNYQYDAIGNLIKDTKENIQNIDWTVYGKIKTITKTDGSTINYTYDAAGNRISKAVTISGTTKYTFYVRDATGNVMGVYNTTSTTSGGITTTGSLMLSELHLYGSSRLGVNNVNINTNVSPVTGSITTFTRGNKFFELSNHLSNVLATISDKKIPVSANSTTIDYYTADVVTANDYYPGGMQMPGRKYSSGGSYRYGFNGQEKSTEIDPSGNSMTAEFWQYDARLGRRWNMDPARKKYPYESPYLAFHNNPIQFSDPNGDDPPKNFKKYTNTVDGNSIYLPSSAKIDIYDEKSSNGNKELVGKIKGFNIGSARFINTFINDKFSGYQNWQNNRETYVSPDIQKNPGGRLDRIMYLRFTLSNTGSSSSGQAIQIVETNNDVTSINPDTKRPISTAKYKSGSMYGFVDGGVNSPAYQAQNAEVSPGNPYMIGFLNGKPYGSVSKTNSGSVLTIEDAPNAQTNPGSVVNFQTILVATNFYGSGQNVVMGVFNWGFSYGGSSVSNNDGQTHRSNVVDFTNIKPSSLEILKTDYKTYQLKQ
jgi:YD repeat-containing protein